MSYEKVLNAKRIIVGTKQTVKAMKNESVREVVIATDADPKLTNKIIETATELNIPMNYVDSMKKLGKACDIEVGATAVAIIL